MFNMSNEGDCVPKSDAIGNADLMYDFEIPVRISLGRTKIPLKDALRLTTGSVLELNQTLEDSVEMVVGNCVLAQGEIVVVEGNYGIRIQQINDKARRTVSAAREGN